MINRIIKFILIALLLALAIFSFVDGKIGNGIFFTLLISLPVLLLFRHEYIIMSLWYLRKQNFEKTRSWLERIKQPDYLIKRQQAYYFFLLGFCLMASQKEATKAGPLFRKALNIGLRMKQDEIVAKLSLAQIAIMHRRKREAKNLIYEIKKMKESSTIKEQIKQVEMMLMRI
ncbi:MAG: DUF2892 domain-containing protein [Bacteroidetes bacterium]|jgi:hypothetical protein|nr:DUF2892 domain-containing protein [Bacteroidota bacterium]